MGVSSHCFALVSCPLAQMSCTVRSGMSVCASEQLMKTFELKRTVCVYCLFCYVNAPSSDFEYHYIATAHIVMYVAMTNEI